MWHPRLYLVTDRQRAGGRRLLEVVDLALQGGVDAVQLREKDLPARQLLDLAHPLCKLCHRFGARFLINDRIDVALAAGADGVHLPANSFRVEEARRLLGAGRLVAASTHHLEEVHTAANEGADFVVFGPIFETPSKLAFGPPQGLDALAAAVAATALPVVAIGGINTVEHVEAVRRCGASGIAVVGAVVGAVDPTAASRELRAALD